MKHIHKSRFLAMSINAFLHDASETEIDFFYAFLEGNSCEKLRDMFKRCESEESEPK